MTEESKVRDLEGMKMCFYGLGSMTITLCWTKANLAEVIQPFVQLDMLVNASRVPGSRKLLPV